jgi:ankyrin repeat protein
MASAVFASLVRHRMRWLLLIALAGIFISLGHSRTTMEKYFSQPTMDLLAALALGDRGATAAALKAGADLNEVGRTGSTPLIYSVIKLDKRLVTALLALGADANRRQEDGNTALSVAYELVSVDPTMLEMLINSGKVDLNSPMLGNDPLLYYLIGSGRLDFLSMALKKGANPSALSGAECPLVVEAVLIEEYDAAQLLLDAGASPSSTDGAGRPVLWWVNDGPSQVMNPAGKTNQARLRLKARLEKSATK